MRVSKVKTLKITVVFFYACTRAIHRQIHDYLPYKMFTIYGKLVTLFHSFILVLNSYHFGLNSNQLIRLGQKREK